MSTAEQPSRPAGSGARTASSTLRRGVRGLLIAGTVLLALLIVTALAARLYLSDHRLRRAIEQQAQGRLGAEVDIEELVLDLLSGVEVRGLRVGPMPGFTLDTLAVERVALHWSLWDLLRRRVTVDEIAVEGVRVAIEQNERGRNTDALMLALQGERPAEPEAVEPAAEPETDRRKPLEQPTLPVRVAVRRLRITLAEARVLRPDLELSFSRMGLEGSFAGEGATMDLRLWLGLGDRDPQGSPSTIALQQRHADGLTVVDTEQRLGIEVASTGLGDVRVTVGLAAAARLGGDKPMPEAQLSGELQVAADLLAEIVQISRCRLAFGRQTDVELVAQAQDILGDPRLGIDTLRAAVDLAELGPYVAAFVPGAELGGTVVVRTQPFAADAKSLARVEDLPLWLGLGVENLRAVLPAGTGLARVDDLDVEAVVTSGQGQAAVEATATLAGAAANGQRLDGLRLHLTAQTPLLPWLQQAPGAPGSLQAAIEATVVRAGAPQGSVRDLQVKLALEGPVALLRKQPASEPLQVDLGLRVGEAVAPKGAAQGVVLDVTAALGDLRGDDVDATVGLRAERVSAPLDPGGTEVMNMPGLDLGLQLRRRGDRIDVGELTLDVARLLRVQLRGAFDKLATAAPHFDDLSVRLEPLDLAAALELLPAGRRPPMSLAGFLALEVGIDGVVPHGQLAHEARFPTPVFAADAEMASVAPLYGAAVETYLKRWVDILDGGLPFTARLDVHLQDVDFADARNEVRGFSLDAGVEIERHSAAVYVRPRVAAVRRPMLVQDVGAGLDARLRDGDLKLDVSAGVAEVDLAGQPNPLRGISFSTVVVHRLGGDCLLERLAFEVRNRGVRGVLSARLNKPLRVVQTHAWQDPDLRGVGASLSFDLGVRSAETLVLTSSGISLRGVAQVAGTVELAQGVAKVQGQLLADGLTLDSGKATVEKVSGELPFDMRFAFQRRSDGVLLARGLRFGGGDLVLLASDDSIRDRAARPVYYARLRPYRHSAGLRIASIRQGGHEISDFELEARIQEGKLLVDWLSMHVLGGDVVGNLGLQLGTDQSLLGDMAFKMSNIDASYFKGLQIEPGPQSELSADMRLGFLFGPRQRDLTLNMNVTKIGPETLDRFLQTLDPAGKNEKLQKNRKKLSWFKGIWLRLDEVAVWIRYENLYMDLEATSFIRVPFTDISYMPVPRELLRRFGLGEYFAVFLQPHIDRYLARPLAWAAAR